MGIIKTFILLFCGMALNCSAQEKNNTFKIIDSLTALPIPSVTVAIVRAGLSITTEKDGIFSIPGDLEKMRDTIIFNTQNYQTLAMPLQDLHGKDAVMLRKLTAAVPTDKMVLKRDTLLNDYEEDHICSFAGLHIGGSEFKYLQIAQKLTAPVEGGILKKIRLNRLAFFVNNGYVIFTIDGPEIIEKQSSYSELEHTKFRIRIYDTNPVTGGPGRDLCEKPIEIKSSDQKTLATNLEKYNIRIPGKSFFIAVEWMRDYLNMGYVQVDNIKNQNKPQTNYRPAIGLLPTKGKKLNIWALKLNQQWSLYTYHSPDFTDLAIKATVSY